MKCRNCGCEVYQRRGYSVKHHIQRTANAKEHLFQIHDQGAAYLPKLRHLIRMFIPKISVDGKRRTIVSPSSGVSGAHSFWYKMIVKYTRESK
jgi:hypothetical protein